MNNLKLAKQQANVIFDHACSEQEAEHAMLALLFYWNDKGLQEMPELVKHIATLIQ